MGESQFILRAIRYGILWMPDRPFWPGSGVKLSEIPKEQASSEFGSQELESGLNERLWGEIKRDKVMASKE